MNSNFKDGFEKTAGLGSIITKFRKARVGSVITKNLKKARDLGANPMKWRANKLDALKDYRKSRDSIRAAQKAAIKKSSRTELKNVGNDIQSQAQNLRKKY